MIDEMGLHVARQQIDARFAAVKQQVNLPNAYVLESIEKAFQPPRFKTSDHDVPARALSASFAAWLDQNTHPHRHDDHAIVSISLKQHGATPGDASAEQMRGMADLAAAYGYDELRVSHEQNIIIPHVAKEDLFALYEGLCKLGLATANIGLISDIIACPGMDYCALATARSIPIAQEIATHFDALKKEQDIGPLKIKISGCINACGHHHVGHIGILGLDRAGVENYQITLGGDGSEDARLGDRTGPGFPAEQLIWAIETIVNVYLEGRDTRDESFLSFYRRVGMDSFKSALYPNNMIDLLGQS